MHTQKADILFFIPLECMLLYRKVIQVVYEHINPTLEND